MNYLSVCSGLEGASLAFRGLDWAPVGFAEIDPFPSAIIAHHYGSNMPDEPLSSNAPPNFGDFTQIDTAALGLVELLVGGTPCQAFSIAGKRLSLADARGNLTLAYVVLAHELARSHGLRNCLWENVVGVLSTPDNAFGAFLGGLVGGDDPIEPVVKPKRGKSNAFWRWREAGFERDDDGNEVKVEEGHITRWPRAGMVAGPVCRAAWRVLDAQYFGLAQRRERVFVVADFGDGADPAAVLFERPSLPGNPAPRREERKDVAGAVKASSGRRGGLSEGECGGLVAAFEGNRTGGELDVATAVRAKGGTGHGDFESETFIAHTLRAEGFDASEDGSGRGTPIVPVAFPANLSGTQFASREDMSPALQALNPTAVAFAQNTRDEVRLQGGDGQISGTPAAEPGMKQTTYVAQCAGPVVSSSAQRGGVPQADAAAEMPVADGFAFDLRGRDGGAMPEGPHDTANLRAASGGSSRSYVAQVAPTMTAGGDRPRGDRPYGTHPDDAESLVAMQWAVRRLTPLECERLQGVPDNYTRIAWRGKPPEECPDGPRYRALGNSWAVPVVAWIARRIAENLPEAA